MTLSPRRAGAIRLFFFSPDEHRAIHHSPLRPSRLCGVLPEANFPLARDHSTGRKPASRNLTQSGVIRARTASEQPGPSQNQAGYHKSLAQQHKSVAGRDEIIPGYQNMSLGIRNSPLGIRITDRPIPIRTRASEYHRERNDLSIFDTNG